MFPSQSNFSSANMAAAILLITHLVVAVAADYARNSTQLVEDAYMPSTARTTGDPFLFCLETKNPAAKNMCNVISDIYAKRLKDQKLTIRKDVSLFNYEDKRVHKLPTGSSCSITAERRYTHFWAKIIGDVDIPLSPEMLNEPAVFTIQAPVQVHGDTTMRYRFGFKSIGCSKYARDTSKARGTLATTADMLVSVALRPKFVESKEFYELRVEAVVRVSYAIASTDIPMRVSGSSRFTKIWIRIKGYVGAALKIARGYSRGESLSRIVKGVKSRLKFTRLHANAAGYRSFSTGARSAMQKVMLKPLEQIIEEKRKNHLQPDQEEALNQQLQTLFDVDGKENFKIPKAFLALVSKAKSL